MCADRLPSAWTRAALAVGVTAAVLSASIGLVAGCAPAKWTVRAAQPRMDLQWPYQPSEAKVTYLRSLTGFAARRSSGTVLKNIVFGAESAERNAFLLPVAVAVGHDGRIAVADLGRRRVHLYIPAEERYVQLSGSKDDLLVSPVGLAFDDGGRLYVSDSAGAVFAFGPDGKVLSVLRQAGADRLQRPTGLAYSSPAQLLYVVDTLASKVYAFRAGGDLAFAFGERGDGPGRFNFPTHIFRSGAGELYVNDSLNFRIAIFDEAGKFQGAFGQHGDGSGDIAMAKGVAVDADGVVYVVDGLFDNVQLFNRQGAFLLTVGKRGTDFGEFWLPAGAFISDDQDLYVCDTYNRRIQVFRLTKGYADARS